MAMRALIVVIAIVGLYLATWHNNVPFAHNQVGLGTTHVIHAIIGVGFLGVAEWLRLRYWNRAPARA